MFHYVRLFIIVIKTIRHRQNYYYKRINLGHRRTADIIQDS